VELEPGVEGLVHVTELSWTKRIAKPSDVLKQDETIEAQVLGINREEQKISLGLRQLESNPWDLAQEKYPPGTKVKGKIRNLTSYGAFIELEEGLDGMIHVSDISWTRKINHPSEVLKKGQIAQAVILHIDPEARRLSLGIKQLQPDAWETFFQNHQVGDIVRGRVSRAASFGVFVEMAPGVEGLCHNSEVPSYDRASGLPPLPVGEEMEFKIIKMHEAERRIGLSVRAVADDEERDRLEEYQRQAAAATMTIEEVISLKEQGESR